MSKEREEFINKYANDVINATAGTGILPSVTMAQFIIESSNNKGETGKGITMLKANNGFGIKADKNYKGEKMAFNTPKDGKPVSYFRVYKNVIDSIKDHTNFLVKNKRYTNAGLFKARTPEEQTAALQKAGYSESPTYNLALNKLISAYNLKKLDNQQPTKTSNKTETNTGLFLLAGLILGTIYFYNNE